MKRSFFASGCQLEKTSKALSETSPINSEMAVESETEA